MLHPSVKWTAELCSVVAPLKPSRILFVVHPAYQLGGELNAGPMQALEHFARSALNRNSTLEEAGESAAVSSHDMNDKAIQITIVALKPGFEEILIPELIPIVDTTRQISGCLAFDLYRLSNERSTLILHEMWNTHEALKAYSVGPLKAEITAVVAKFLAQPLQSWEIEEVA